MADAVGAGEVTVIAGSAIPATRYASRLAAAAEAARGRGVDALLIGVGPELRYLSGYVAMPLERLTMLVLPGSRAPRLVAPRLEAVPARSCPAAAAGQLEVLTWEETDDPYALVASLVSGEGVVGVSDTLWARHLLALEARLPRVAFRLATDVLRDLRMRKDRDEIELLRRAAHAADRVVAAIATGSLVGRTEADVAREVRERLLAEGHESASFAIVASGPNSASPHHDASERVIRAGEPIVLDIGGALGGYGSDITRTIWVAGAEDGHGPDPEFARLYEVLQGAQAAATAAVAPGVPAEQVDAAGREVIAAAGYADAFIHRIGHGIGLEEHEEPYLVAGNHEPLDVGMAFSVEPGIYLEGRFGARIEDIVVCAAAGPDVLNEAPRDLYVVAG